MTKKQLATTLLLVSLLALIITATLSTTYTTGQTLDTQLFPHSQYWSITTQSGANVITLTTYNPQVWYLAVGDRVTVSYVDNR